MFIHISIDNDFTKKYSEFGITEWVIDNVRNIDDIKIY